MNRFDLASAFGVLVLTAGLASCSKEQEKVRDSYKTPPPVIVTGKGNQGFLQWERESDKTLDLQDAFDVSAGNPARTEVLARCMREKISFTAKFTVNGRRPVKILQVLPTDILFDDLAKSAVTCDWEVSLSNEVGSRHVIRLPISPISDRGNPEVVIESSIDTNRIKILQIMKTEGIKIRYRNSEPASAEIICRDVTFEPLPFEKVLELSRFDLRRPSYRPSRSEANVMQTPLQPCRLAVYESGQIKQISALMMIHMPRQALEIQAGKIFSENPNLNIDYFFRSESAVAGITINNPAQVARIVQIPSVVGTNLGVILKAEKKPIAGGPNVLPSRAIMNLPWSRIQILNPVPVIKDEPAGWTVSIPPQSTLQLRVLFRLQQRGCFKKDNSFSGFVIRNTIVTLNEIMPSGELVQSYGISLPEIWWGITPEQYNNTPAYDTPCI